MTTSSVLYKLRRILGDMGESFSSATYGDGVVSRFELPVTIVDPTSVQVVTMPADGGSPSVLTQNVDYIVDSYNGLVTLGAPLATGQVINITGVSYETWTDTDLLDYIQTALQLHTLGRNPPVYLDAVGGAAPPTQVLPLVEERPLAILAAREVYRDLATTAARSITIDTGDGTVIPRGQTYQQLNETAAVLDDEYTEIVEKLGISGYDTITMGNLRRVSPTTNRLVPLYVTREWDDHKFPQRIMPPIDIGIGSQGFIVTYRGLWNSVIAYNLNDEVDLGSTRYLCVAANTNQNPADDVAAHNMSLSSPETVTFVGNQPVYTDPENPVRVNSIEPGSANWPTEAANTSPWFAQGQSGFYWQVTYINSGVAGYYGGGGW